MGEAPVVVARSSGAARRRRTGARCRRRSVVLPGNGFGCSRRPAPPGRTRTANRSSRPDASASSGRPRHEHLVDPVPDLRRGRPGIGLPTPGRRPQEWSRIEIQSSGSDLGALAVDVDPARRHADLVVAQHIVRDSVAVGTAIRPRILERRGEARPRIGTSNAIGACSVRVERGPESTSAVRPPRSGSGPTTVLDGSEDSRRPAPHRPLLGAAAHTRRPRRKHPGWCTCRHRARPAASCPARARWSRSSRSRTDPTDRPSRTCPRSGGSAFRPREPVPRNSSTTRTVASSQRGLPAFGGDPKNAVMSVPRSYSRIQVSAHWRQRLLGRIMIRGLRKCQSPHHSRQFAGRHGIEQRRRARTSRARLRAPPGPRNLNSSTSNAGDISSRADAPRSSNGTCSSNAAAMLAASVADVPERLSDVLDAVPRIGVRCRYRIRPGTAVLDLLHEVPHHQRRDTLVTAAEQRVAVVQDDLEQRGERRFEVGDVRGSGIRRADSRSGRRRTRPCPGSTVSSAGYRSMSASMCLRCAAACCASCRRNASASAATSGSSSSLSCAWRSELMMYFSNGTAMKVKALQKIPKFGLAGCHRKGTLASNSHADLADHQVRHRSPPLIARLASVSDRVARLTFCCPVSQSWNEDRHGRRQCDIMGLRCKGMDGGSRWPRTPSRRCGARILDATHIVLSRSGHQKLQLSEVAAEAGVSRPTLYRYFGSQGGVAGSLQPLRAGQLRRRYRRGDGGPARARPAGRRARSSSWSSRTRYSARAVVDIEPGHVLARDAPGAADRCTNAFAT